MAILKPASEKMRSGLATKSADVTCAVAVGASFRGLPVEFVAGGR